MKRIIKISIFVAVAALTFSCTDEFDKINTDPNRLTTADAETLFLGAPVRTMMTFGSDNNFWIFGNYSGQISMAGGVYPSYGSDGRAENMWEDLYLKCLNPLITIERQKEKDPAFANRVAIIRIWKSYIFSEMVAMWGPIPYSDACTGNVNPKYDSESYIYTDLLSTLKSAADSLNVTKDKFSSAKKEPVFGSDIEKWRKFAHSIRLRIASRLIDFEDAGVRDIARQVVKEELDHPETLINSNAENCSMNFTDDKERDFRNPFFVAVSEKGLSDGTYPVMHEQVMMYLIAYNDPRLYVFAKTADFVKAYWKYRGRPSTTRVPEWDRQILDNPHNGAKQEYYSYIKEEFSDKTAKWMIITYPEICCIRTEAAYRGIWGSTADAKDLYYKSIDAFRDRYATAIPIDSLQKYKNNWGIKWYEGGAPYPFEVDTTTYDKAPNPLVNSKKTVQLFTDYLGVSNCVLSDRPEDNPLSVNNVEYNIERNANYKRIVLQHWMALFFQGIDSWTLLRRTQQLQFTPMWSPDTDEDTDYPKDCFWAYLPQRLPYPRTSEVKGNAAQARRAIDMIDAHSNSIQAKLKFAKPVRDFSGERYKELHGYEFPNRARCLVKQ